jgi:hypothetical protein
MSVRYLAAAVLLTGFLGAGASAQTAWESPILIPPAGTGGVGLYLTEPAFGDLGFMITYRSRAGGQMGYRIGLAEDRSNDVAVFGGFDLGGLLTPATVDFPLDVGWYTGAGAGIGNDVLLSFPLGVSMGRTVVNEGVRFTPYVAPRLVLDAWLGRSDPPGDDLDLAFAVDLGVILAFQSSWEIRFGASLADHDALAVGLGLPSR